MNAIFSCLNDRGDGSLENEKLHVYIEGITPARSEFFQKMEQFANENGVPIMELAGIEMLLQLLRIQQPKAILEVGTAIGYSALRMADALPNCKIVTIERDAERSQLAEQYRSEAGKDSQIHIIKGDALEVEAEVKEHGPFDAIFIDAAKGQYRRFFEIYSRYLSDKGVIITDNVLFKGLVCESEFANRNIRQLVRKIDQFNYWLMNHPDFHTAIVPVGDGVAISKKR